MKNLRDNLLQAIAEDCTQCGLCGDACEHMQSHANNPGEIARTLMKRQSKENITEFILKCSLCGLCSEVCLEDIDVSGMVRQGRQDFLEAGVSDSEDYRALWVDHDWNAFSLFRQQYKLNEFYLDLYREKCEVLFFPGCMLANEGPALVKDAVDWLDHQGKDVGVIVDCCGGPLKMIGMAKRSKAYGDSLWRSIETTNAKQVVTACPTCHAHLKAISKESDIEIISLFKIMAKAGLSASVHGDGIVTVHDSCSDRNGDIGKYIRQMLSNYELKEMVHHGTNTVCCGSGGIVSLVDPDVCEDRAASRLAEVVDSGAKLCVSYCMSCAHRLVGRPGIEVRHILELLFNQPIDHVEFDAKTMDVWQGGKGDENYNCLLKSTLKTF